MLRRLELKNFRNYDHLVQDFDAQGRTLIIGENGTGKSTVKDAISWLLLGQCRGVDGKGAGQKDLIRLGADTMSVTGVWDGLGPVTRSIARNGSASASQSTDAILGQLKVSAGMLAAVLAGQAFFAMHHADAKALLMKLLDVRIPKDQLPGVDLPDSVADVDLGYLEQLFDAAFQDRAVVKKSMASIQVPEQPKVVSIDLGGKTLADVRRQLAKDQNDLMQAVADHGKAERALADQRAELDRATKLVATVEANRGGRQVHVDSLTVHQTQLAEAKADLATVEAAQAEPVGALEVQLREAASLVDKIDRHTQAGTQSAAAKGRGSKKNLVVGESHGCVLSAAIPCLTAISEFQGQVAALKAQQKVLEDRIRAGNERARAIAAATQKVKESERHVTYHETQIADIDAKILAAEAARGTVPTLMASIDTADVAVADAAKLMTDRRDVVQRLQQQVGELAAYEQAQKNYQAAVERRQALEDQVKKAEALVDLLGPKGLRLQYLDNALGDFQAAINVALEPFGFSLAINVEPWRVEVNRGDGVVRFELLSKGQQLWTGLAFQIALAAMSGLEFCFLDDAEAVVGLNRGLLTDLIMAAPVEQIVVAMAKADDDQDPDIEGLQVIRLGVPAVAVG